MKTTNTLTEAELYRLKKEVCESLANDRQHLLIKHPFCGGVLMRLNLIPVRDIRVRSACTTGTNIYFDISFYGKLSADERQFVLAHEVWHCIMLHFARLQTRDRNLFNVAADMEVNYLLKQDGLIPPKDLCWPPSSLEGSSAEMYYEYLLKQEKKQQKNGNSQQQNSGFGSGSGSSSSNNQQANSKNKSGNTQSNKDNSNTPYGNQFDKHVFADDTDDVNDANDENGDGNDNAITDEYGKVGIDPDFKPIIASDTAERIREAVTASAQRYERLKGDLPAHYSRYITAIRKPEISWKEVLAQFVTSTYNGSRRWLPPSRRHCYKELYLQSRRQERIKVCVAIDTSGSTSDDLPKFMTELVGLLNSFGGYDLTVIQCDCKVDKVDHYDDNDPFPIDNINKFEFTGGGGTSFVPVFDYIKEYGIETNCLVYFTDSYGDAPRKAPNYPVLWVLTADGNENFCSWGRKLKFKLTK